jgi:hypothetical protein
LLALTSCLLLLLAASTAPSSVALHRRQLGLQALQMLQLLSTAPSSAALHRCQLGLQTLQMLQLLHALGL